MSLSVEELTTLANEIRNFIGVTRKKPIIHVTSKLVATLNFSLAKILRSFGEDCAIIELDGNNELILFAADGIWHKLVEADPYFAGYCSVLVNVNDIVAKGGKPMAIVDVLGLSNQEKSDKIVAGIIDGCKKFGVACVGGHLHPDSPMLSISVAILGLVHKDHVIFSDTAKIGDSIIIAIDLDGMFHSKFKLAWDTTSHKSPEKVREKFEAIYRIAEEKLATACKDISNPGSIGTLAMLLEASNVGGKIDIEKIPRPENINLLKWVKVYPGFGVVLTSSKSNSKKCIRILEDYGISASIVGKVIQEKRLYLGNNDKYIPVFDFSKDNISGKPQPKK